MKFLFLGQSVEDASTRYRLLQYIPYVKSRGAEIRVEAIPSGHREKAALFSSISCDEIVVLQKKLFSIFDLRRLAKRVGRLIYDFDDAMMYPDSFSGKKFSRTRERKFRRTVRAAQTIIAGNEYLKEKVEVLGSRALIIPTPVDTDVYLPGTKEYSDGITLGWLGSNSTLPYLEKLLPVLEKTAANVPKLKLVVVCDRPVRAAGMEIENRVWSADREVEDLRSFHIGLMPLVDDHWARGKCGFKLLQYMAVGIPAVASPVGVNNQIVQDGVNSFLAGNEDEWVNKLNILINNRELRKTIGEKARQTVDAKYSLAVNAPLFFDAISKDQGF